jgi:hypothetical protein
VTRRTREHVCDPTVPVCSCGRRWTWKQTYSDGHTLYTCDEVRWKFVALYGEPTSPPFEPAAFPLDA